MTGASLWMPKKPNRHKRGRSWKVKNTSQSQNWRKVPQMLYAPYIRYFPFSLHILTPEHSMQKNNNIHQKTHLHIECLPKQASCFGWLPHHLPNEGHISKIKFIWSFWKQLTEVTSQVAQTVKNPPSMQETWVPSLGFQDPLEQGLAYDSSMVAWRIPWTVESGRL